MYNLYLAIANIFKYKAKHLIVNSSLIKNN